MIYWNSLADFLAMGGYGFYVWWSFGITAAVMALEPIFISRQHNQTVARLTRQLRAEATDPHKDSA